MYCNSLCLKECGATCHEHKAWGWKHQVLGLLFCKGDSTTGEINLLPSVRAVVLLKMKHGWIFYHGNNPKHIAW